MKNRIFIAFIASIIAIASLNAISETSDNDINMNQVGIATIIIGVNTESSIATSCGIAVTASGATAVAKGIGTAAVVVATSNPIGWIMFGCGLIV
jgi:hypothetical protein